MTAEETHADTTDVDCANACVALTHLQASRFPLMRRFDQQYVVEDKLTTYQHEISRLSSINRNALSSLDDQERRLRDMQARLRGTSSTPTSSAARSCLATRSENDVPKHCCGGPQHEEKYVLTSFDAGDVLHPTTSQMIAISTDQTQILPDDITPMDADDCFPTAPTNLRASEVTHDSLSLQWDVVHDRSIVDFEIRYCYLAEGSEKEVRLSCARWCLKDPVPTNGRFVVKSLQPNTTYRNISIRSRNHVGWGTFSDPVPCLTTASKDDDFDCRRSKFLYRIGYIADSIDELETELGQIPAKQMALANNMANSERRMMALNEEVERVAMHGENEQLSSHLLHGATQTFSQAVLKRTLEYELSVCKKHMAEWRALIIDLDVERREIAAEIEHATDRLNERKAALAGFDKQRAAVSGMRRAISSKAPDQLKRYYISRWKSRVANRLDTRDKLDFLAKSCRRRIYSKVWRKLSLLVKSREELLQGERHNEADGIGGMLLGQAESSVEETVADACLLIYQLDHLNVEANPADSKTITRNSSSYPANLLCKEDGTTLLKGDFLYKSGHYDQALKSYERVLSKMEDRVYFSGLKSADAAALYAEVNGKMGHAQVKLNSFDLGLVYFGRQLALAEEEDLDAPRAEALLGLGICSHHKADYFYSESLLKQALEVFSSMGNQQEAKQLACYEWLKKCYECLNLNDRKELFANKCKELDRCANDRLNREHAVKESIGRLDSMRNRLVNVMATNSQVIKMEIVSAHFVKLLRLKAKKEKELMESTEHLSATAQSAEDLQGLIDQIEAEIAGARQTKKGFLVSRLIQGHNQEVKAAELLIRLEEELKVVRVQHDESLADISQTEMIIKNLNDDIIVLREELVVEQCPLMQRVLQGRTYRCASLNASNIAANDVTGKSKNGYPNIALSDGETCYIHNLETGKMEHAFVGDEDGGTAIITSLCFRGHQVYTGTMDSTLIAWDTNTSSKNWSATGHEAAVTCIYADDSKVISGSADQTIILWSASEGTLLWKQAGHSRGVHCISASHSSIVSTSFATILVWDIIADERGPSQKIKSLDCRCRFVSEGNVTALQYGELEIITGDDLGRISVWWVETSELLRTFPVHKGKVTALQVDATKVVSSGTDGLIHISDLFRGETLHTLRGHSNPLLSVSFDGNQIISLSSEGELRYWPWEK